MKSFFLRTCLAPLALVATSLAARAETTIALDIDFGIRHVPPARVTVPKGELLRITAANFGPVRWTKDGKPIAGATDTTLIFPSVSASDAGSYVAVYADMSMAGRTSQSLVLGVGPTDRFLNLSARGTVGPTGDSVLTAGFVVAGSSPGKKIIVRAIGPSLALFGVANPLAQPVLRIFDATGRPYTNGYAYPAVIGGPTYESDLADSLSRAGAFGLPSGTRDVVTMMPVLPGSYTAQVTSGDGTTGSVLLEVYEVP
jgi:hypothetical protein